MSGIIGRVVDKGVKNGNEYVTVRYTVPDITSKTLETARYRAVLRGMIETGLYDGSLASSVRSAIVGNKQYPGMINPHRKKLRDRFDVSKMIQETPKSGEPGIIDYTVTLK